MRIFAPLNSEPEPCLQEIELATFFQLPSFHIIGLPSPEISEARERVRSAIQASGLEFPRRRVVINLSPASIRKRGTGVDLAIALAVLSEGEGLFDRVAAWGELSLDGTVKGLGQLTRSLFASYMGKVECLLVPAEEYQTGMRILETLRTAHSLRSMRLVGVRNLAEAWCFLSTGQEPEAVHTAQEEGAEPHVGSSGESIEQKSLLRLHPILERVVAVSIAGGHHLLLLGPKGVGKSQAMEWAIALLPELSPAQQLRRDLISELSDPLFKRKLPEHSAKRPPARRVSSQTRPAALIGSMSSSFLLPGEFSLAHEGLLLADELPEWPRDSREVLREPLERGRISLTRVQGSHDLPSRFQLIANGNLCGCGGWPITAPQVHASREPPKESLRCRCKPSAREAYALRLSGPILDRMDLVVLMLSDLSPGIFQTTVNMAEHLQALRSRVEHTRKKMVKEWGGLPAQLEASVLENLLAENTRLRGFLDQTDSGSLRSRHKTLRTALSFAAWEESPPELAHFIEAAQYRVNSL